ncbi:MAG: PDZ domain-containing protein, partial [SAR324 cluster bacterium]
RDRFPLRLDAAALPVLPISAFDSIYTTNIFHARRTGAGNGAATAADAGPARLTLTGIFRIGADAFAIVIGPDGRTEGVYRVGQCMPRQDPEQTPPCPPGQARLVRVEHDRITVDFGGQRAVIAMETQPANPPPSAQAAPLAAQAQLQEPNTPFGQTRTGNTIEVHLPSAEVEKSFENFSEIVRQALVVPFMKDGAAVGFQIQRIQPGSVFQRLGLQNQDVIRSVNGEAITTADQALRLFSLFRNERNVTLDVDRGADTLKMSYVIE